MAWTALQILVTASSLLVSVVVVAQRDVVLSVGYDGTSRDNVYHLGFDISLFTEFHECLSKGTDNCVIRYGAQHCPYCIVETVRQNGQNNQESNNFYKCTNDASNGKLNCQRQTKILATPGIPLKSYRLQNSSYPSTCFGFVWTLDTEGISFINKQLEYEDCGDNCDCPVRSTTLTSRSTTISWPSTPVTSSSSRSSTPSATTPQTSSTKTPRKTTTVVATSNFSYFSTESLPRSSAGNSGNGTPTAAIVGAAVGVIAIIIIVIVIVVVWRRRKVKAKAQGYADHGSSNGAEVRGKSNDENLHSYHNTEFSDSHAPNNGVIKTNGYQNSLHQPNITKNVVTSVKDLPKPQFAIKDNDSDFGYSTAQLVVPKDNNKNVNGKKSRDDYDYVYAENDVDVSDPTPQTTRDKTSVVSLQKVRDDYAVIDKTRKNKSSSNTDTNMGLMSDYDDIPEEDYGYSHAEGDPSSLDTNKAAVGRDHVTVPNRNLPGSSDLHQDNDYEYSRACDGYTTVGNVNQSDPNNDDPNATSVYSRLHDPVRDIQNPYNVGPNTGDVYSKLHEEVRDIKNPYNVLPEPQGPSDSNNALPDTAHNAQHTKEQKPTKSLPYGPQDYAVVVKTKSANKPTQSTFELENDDN